MIPAALVCACVLAAGLITACGDTIPASVDRSFGSGGVARTPIQVVAGGAKTRAWANALVIQKDGKLVAAGWAQADPNCVDRIDPIGNSNEMCATEFALVRYRMDGTLDRSFGSGGVVLTARGSCGAVDKTTSHPLACMVDALAIQKDGMLVAAGEMPDGVLPSDLMLVRYLANGKPDWSFGSGGVGRVVANATPNALAIQNDGKLVVAASDSGPGCSDYSCPTRFALVCYLPDGRLDRSFGSGGVVRMGSGEANALVIEKDGKLVAAGSMPNSHGAYGHFAIVRYLASGRLDRSFGSGGVVETQIATDATATALAIQTDGKLVAAGYSGPACNDTSCPTDFAFVRYLANGRIDRTFGRRGVVRGTRGAGDAGASALAIQKDGKLVAAGYRGNGLAVVRYQDHECVGLEQAQGQLAAVAEAPVDTAIRQRFHQ